MEVSAGFLHTCAILDDGSVRCWGWGESGQLGYGNTETIGDNETPASVGPVNLGAGRTAVSISAGHQHTCAILDNATVRCWGNGAQGQLGYGNKDSIGDNETPASAGPVDLGAGRTAVAIAVGFRHTCAILDDGSVRCWGWGEFGQLGYGNTEDIGDTETPGSAGPVDLGPGRTAVAISAGNQHTCAILDNGTVLCWGEGEDGRLGYGNTEDIGDTEVPGSVAPVDLGGQSTVAISAGDLHTCAILDDATVRCWGRAEEGQLGYGNMLRIGDDEPPGSVGAVNLGAGRTAVAISTGSWHSCALLDDATMRCWGFNDAGELGYGINETIGDTETPDSVGPVNLGAGHTAIQLTAGGQHTCAIRDDAAVLCWGWNIFGELGYGNTETIGDNETPGSVGPIDLVPSPAVSFSLPPPGPAAPQVLNDFPPPPPPVAGKNVDVESTTGTVRVKCPRDKSFAIVEEVERLPLKCLVDTRHGTALLTASKGGGETQSAFFWGGVFSVTQKAGRNRDAVLTLAGALNCKTTSSRGRRARISGRRSRGSSGRRLWGKGEGNFKTVGKYGSATVRGTTWLVADRCDDSTLFQVKKGTVLVRDFVKQRSLTLKSGGQYIAAPERGRP